METDREVYKMSINNESQFIVIDSYKDILLGDYCIVYHKDTKVMYVVSKPNTNTNFTLLVNPDGSPMIFGSGQV